MVRRHIGELTSLRFFAALAVVIYHLHGLGFIDAARIHDVLDGGRTAVAFFFTLSGFVLAVRYGPGQSMSGYVTARFARVYPVHALTLLLSVVPVLLIVWHSPDLAESLFFIKDRPAVSLSLSFVAQVFLLTAWLPFAAFNQPWNGPAWSLSCEAFFYALFPRLRRWILRIDVRAIFMFLVLGWIVQALWLIAVVKLVASSRAGHIVYQFPLSHLFEFFAGVCIGVLHERGVLQTLRRYRAAVLAAAAAAIAILSWVQPVAPVYYLMSPVFLAVIAAIAAAERPIALLANRHLQLLGQASYSLYLVHVPVLLTLKALDLAVHPLLLVPVLVLASVLLFKYVEEPCRRKIAGLARARNAVPQMV